MQIRLDPDGTNLQPDKGVGTSKITNVLIFKDGYYYLTISNKEIERRLILDDPYCNVQFEEGEEGYMIVPDDWKINNGFEFASDAYAYLAHLKDNTPKTTEPEE